MFLAELKKYLYRQTLSFSLLFLGILVSLFLLIFLYQSSFTQSVMLPRYTKIEIILDESDRIKYDEQAEFFDSFINEKFNFSTRYVKVASYTEDNILLCGTWVQPNEGIRTHLVENNGREFYDSELSSRLNYVVISKGLEHIYYHDNEIVYEESEIEIAMNKYLVLGQGSITYPILHYENTSFASAVSKNIPILSKILVKDSKYSYIQRTNKFAMIPLLTYIQNKVPINYAEVLIPRNINYNESKIGDTFNKLFPNSSIITKSDMIDFNQNVARARIINFVILALIGFVNVLSLFYHWLDSKKKHFAIYKLCGFTVRKIYFLILNQLVFIYTLAFSIALLSYIVFIPILFSSGSKIGDIYSVPNLVDGMLVYISTLLVIWLVTHKRLRKLSSQAVVDTLKER